MLTCGPLGGGPQVRKGEGEGEGEGKGEGERARERERQREIERLYRRAEGS